MRAWSLLTILNFSAQGPTNTYFSASIFRAIPVPACQVIVLNESMATSLFYWYWCLWLHVLITSHIYPVLIMSCHVTHLASLAKWLSVRLWTKWLWVRVELQSLKLMFVTITIFFIIIIITIVVVVVVVLCLTSV